MASINGIVRLDNRDYLIELTRYQKSLANPFAAKLGAGAGSYDDLEDYSVYLEDSWVSGIGKEANAGGLLYGETDSRFRGKMLLSPEWTPVHQSVSASYPYSKSLWDDIIEVYEVDGTTNQAVAHLIDASVSDPTASVWFYLGSDTPISVKLDVYDGISAPDTLLQSATIITEVRPGFYWYRLDIATPITTDRWVVISPTESGDVLKIPLYRNTATNGDNEENVYRKVSGTWSKYAARDMRYITDMHLAYSGSSSSNPGSESPGITSIVKFDGKIRVFYFDAEFTIELSGDDHYIDPASFLLSGGSGYAMHDAMVFNSNLYMASLPTEGPSYRRAAGGPYSTSTTVNASLYARWNGFLYAAYRDELRYSTDGTTWSGPFSLGTDDFYIRGMAGFDDSNDVYLATDEALFKFAEGDFTFHIINFGSVRETNGRGMINHQGDLYIPADGRLYRYGSNGSILDIWISKEEDLPAERIGEIYSLASMNNFLLACVEPSVAEGKPTIWAWNGEGWHHLATLPAGVGAGPMYYDYETNLLWVGSNYGMMFKFYIPDSGSNPLRDTSSQYQPFGFFETDWFDGGLTEIYKDFHSIYIDGENIDADCTVAVYWQDDGSTAWEKLGEFTSAQTEIEWDDYTIRPDSRRIKLGVLLSTKSQSSTPVLEAIRLKFHNMINDRWRWQISVRAEHNPTGTQKKHLKYTAPQMRKHINSLIAQRQPIKFDDMDGATYMVKVQQAFETPVKYEIVNSEPRYDSMHTLTIAEV